MSSCPILVLQSWPAQWGSPSLTPACVHVEAYLRLADIPYTLQPCVNASLSPSGVLPTLETGEKILGPTGGECDRNVEGTVAADVILAHLRTVKDLGRGLSALQQAESAAFTALVERALLPATSYFTFLDPQGFGEHTRAAYAAGLPLPLNHITPRRWRRVVAAQHTRLHADTVVEGATATYAALAARLKGRLYFHGDTPSAIDALLFAHLNYHYRAPVCVSDLRPLVAAHACLVSYIQRLDAAHFATAPPPPPPVAERTCEQAAEVEHMRRTAACTWTEWLWGATAVGQPTARSEKERRFKRRGQYFMAAMASVVVVYTLLLGAAEVVELLQLEDDQEESESEDDEY